MMLPTHHRAATASDHEASYRQAIQEGWKPTYPVEAA
jgi:hypothetical protein